MCDRGPIPPIVNRPTLQTLDQLVETRHLSFRPEDVRKTSPALLYLQDIHLIF